MISGSEVYTVCRILLKTNFCCLYAMEPPELKYVSHSVFKDERSKET